MNGSELGVATAVPRLHVLIAGRAVSRPATISPAGKPGVRRAVGVMHQATSRCKDSTNSAEIALGLFSKSPQPTGSPKMMRMRSALILLAKSPIDRTGDQTRLLMTRTRMREFITPPPTAPARARSGASYPGKDPCESPGNLSPVRSTNSA